MNQCDKHLQMGKRENVVNGGGRSYFPSFRIPGTAAGWYVFLIVILGVVCYCNSFSVPFIFDDYDAIVDNKDVFGSQNLLDILLHGGSRRIADFSFAANYKLHGLQVAGYHIINLTIHLSTAVVLFYLCTTLLEALDLYRPTSEPQANTPARSTDLFIPLAASLLFVCHPLQTQAVTYIVQRYTSLASLFYLLALLAYVKGRISFELRGFNGALAGWGLFLIGMTLLGIYTKPIFFSLPLMIFMLEFCLFHGRRLTSILMVFGVSAILLVLDIILPALLNGSSADILLDLDHATSEDLYTSRTSYFLTQLRVIVTYLRLLIFPVRQRLDYDYPEFSTLLNSDVGASLALHVVLITLAIVLFVHSRNQLSAINGQHGRSVRLIVIGIAWFYIALSVESSFIPITDVIMEHRIYLPSAGFFIAFAATLHVLVQKFKGRLLSYRWVGLATLCVLLSVITIKRNQVWGDELFFWQNEAALSPQSGRVIANLGLEYLERDNHEQALRNFVDALKLEPNLSTVWTMLDNALDGLGCYQGRFKLNDEYLTPEGEINYRDYTQFYSNEFNNMGLANEYIGQSEEAFKWYKKSLAINPRFDLALFNLGLLSARLGIAENVKVAISKLTDINPQLASVLENNLRSDNQVK